MIPMNRVESVRELEMLVGRYDAVGDEPWRERRVECTGAVVWELRYDRETGFVTRVPVGGQ